MNNRFSLCALIVIVVLVLDQATKLYINGTMRLFQSIPVIDGLFSITYMRNKGAAFSFLSDFSMRRPFFISVSIIAVIAIMVALGKMRDDQRFATFSLSLILAGAIGNLIDRARLGEVIDFLDVFWRDHHWPAFNVADSAICVGVFLLAVDMLLEEKRQKRRGE